jgi:hypothetical protein
VNDLPDVVPVSAAGVATLRCDGLTVEVDLLDGDVVGLRTASKSTPRAVDLMAELRPRCPEVSVDDMTETTTWGEIQHTLGWRRNRPHSHWSAATAQAQLAADPVGRLRRLVPRLVRARAFAAIDYRGRAGLWAIEAAAAATEIARHDVRFDFTDEREVVTAARTLAHPSMLARIESSNLDEAGTGGLRRCAEAIALHPRAEPWRLSLGELADMLRTTTEFFGSPAPHIEPTESGDWNWFLLDRTDFPWLLQPDGRGLTISAAGSTAVVIPVPFPEDVPLAGDGQPDVVLRVVDADRSRVLAAVRPHVHADDGYLHVQLAHPDGTDPTEDWSFELVSDAFAPITPMACRTANLARGYAVAAYLTSVRGEYENASRLYHQAAVLWFGVGDESAAQRCLDSEVVGGSWTAATLPGFVVLPLEDQL